MSSACGASSGSFPGGFLGGVPRERSQEGVPSGKKFNVFGLWGFSRFVPGGVCRGGFPGGVPRRGSRGRPPGGSPREFPTVVFKLQPTWPWDGSQEGARPNLSMWVSQGFQRAPGGMDSEGPMGLKGRCRWRCCCCCGCFCCCCCCRRRHCRYGSAAAAAASAAAAAASAAAASHELIWFFGPYGLRFCMHSYGFGPIWAHLPHECI